MPDPTDLLLARVLNLVRDGHVHQAIEVAAAAVQAKGKASLIEVRRPRDIGTPRQEFLRAVQAAAEELDRIALAVAEDDRGRPSKTDTAGR
jgi:hypothetical protein